MKFIWNWFSGKTYTEINDNLISEDGRIFMKTPTGYVSEQGDFIQQTSNGLLNTTTGEWSMTTDVFDRNNGY